MLAVCAGMDVWRLFILKNIYLEIIYNILFFFLFTCIG